MVRKVIHQFMWGYQEHYRISVERLAKNVFEALGVPLKPKALIVGARRPGSDNKNLVCVEPENSEWSIDLFIGLLDTIEEVYKNHPHQNLIYSNSETATREKPESMRRDSVSSAIEQALKPYDTEYKVRSFCRTAYLVDEYYIVPVIQIPEEVFEKYYPLSIKTKDETFFSAHPSFIHAAISGLLGEAHLELKRENPGRGAFHDLNLVKEIVRRGASAFLGTPVYIINNRSHDFFLFEKINIISSLMYEGTKGKGRLLLVNSENPAIEYDLRLIEPVTFRDPRHARKILQMASQDIMLIADGEKIHGLGKLRDEYDATQQDTFIIDFLDHYYWQLRCGDQILIQSKYGEPLLPQEVVSHDKFLDNYSRLFPQTSLEQQNHIWQLFNCAINQNHGSMLVIAADAADEAQRLARQGTPIKPTLMTAELFQRVSGIDGTIILDPYGICHAIGVILDGFANEQCTPSRGSRFNSGVRYVEAKKKQRLAIVVSDDKTVDIFPLLRPRIEKIKIIHAIEQLEQATEDNYHDSRNWLDKHRFYLDAEQCERINAELHRIDNLPLEEFEIRLMGDSFKPHPDMDESYFLC